MVRETGKASTNIQMEINLEATGKMMKSYMDIINFMKADNLRADLKVIK